jgi:hypothetical protein
MDLFKCSARTVQRIWKHGKSVPLENAEQVLVAISPKKKKRNGRKRKSIDIDAVQTVPLSKRKSIRSLAFQLGVSPSLVFREYKRRAIKAHSSSLRPLLAESNRMNRMRFVLSKLIYKDGQYSFDSFYQYVHIDEKWFYMTRINERYYIVPGERLPHRSLQSKNFIPKVMFLAAVARPRRNESGDWIFDGKIGIWPFVETKPAKRRSKNRPRGAPVTQPIIVNRQIYRHFLGDKLILYICADFPDLTKQVIIQQDNARPHIAESDSRFRDIVEDLQLDCVLKNQTPNSPDFNVLDLGFFNSIQSMQQQNPASNIDELIESVIKAYNEIKPETLNNVWLTMMKCMEACLENEGNNKYRIPHVNKQALIKKNELPTTFSVPTELVARAETILAQYDMQDEYEF